ncbi:MAG: hypothetical protein ACYTG1_05590 [Planctomycetota bacterium]
MTRSRSCWTSCGSSTPPRAERRPRPARAALGLLAALTAAAGCGKKANVEPGLLGVAPLPALGGPAVNALDHADDGPSLTTIDRGDWPAVTMAVPIRQVEHQPTWTTRFAADPPLDRRAGVYPTALSAVESEHDAGGQVVDAGAEIVHAAWELVVMPVRMFTAQPRRSPADAYERLPHPSDRPWWPPTGRPAPVVPADEPMNEPAEQPTDEPGAMPAADEGSGSR